MSEEKFNVAVEVAMRDPHNLRTFSEKSIVWAQNEIAQLRAERDQLMAQKAKFYKEKGVLEIISAKEYSYLISAGSIIPDDFEPLYDSPSPRITEQDELKSVWSHGYNLGHNDGIGCGHSMAPRCRHDAENEFDHDEILDLLNKLNAEIKPSC